MFQTLEIAHPYRCSSKSTKRFTKHIRTTSAALKDNVSKKLKRASRRISMNELEIPSELCSNCVEHVLHRSEDSVDDIRLVTSLSLTFDGSCSQQEFHIGHILGMMGGLNRLEVTDARTTPRFFATLVQKAYFQLEYFACGSPLFDTLLHFLSTQRQLLEFTSLPQSLEVQAGAPVRGQEILHSVQTLNTTARLLLYPRLNVASLRDLTYVGGGQSLGEELRAIEKIYQLGPQLRSLRFVWGAGRAETFLDVTKFFCIATNTSSVEHLSLSDISQNMFEQFIATGLRHRTWNQLQTLVWISSPPHENDLDEPGSPVSPMSPIFPLPSRFVDLPDEVEVGHPPRPRRQSTSSSWNSTTSSVSSRSAFTTSASSSGTRSSSISHMGRFDLSFRIDCIGKELMTTFPSLRRLALWNWNRLGYDLLTRAAGGLAWTYNAEIDRDGWLLV